MSDSPFAPVPDPFDESPIEMRVELPAGTRPAMFVAQADVIRGLLAVGGLSPAGLAWARSQLRTGMWQVASVPVQCLSERLDMGEAIAQRLAAGDPSMAAYYLREFR
jgi:hypothetical protein